MKETLETIIKNLVEYPDEVSVNENEKDGITVFEVKVKETDMGKVIGREGKIATSIRTLIKALAIKENKKVSVEFLG